MEKFKHCASVLFAHKTAEIFHSGISQRDDTGWKMSILLPESTAIFLLVKGPLNKLALKNIIRKMYHSSKNVLAEHIIFLK